MADDLWRRRIEAQGGLIRRDQLHAAGVTPGFVRAQLASARWRLVTPTVIASFTGELTRLQVMWAGVLHGGPGAAVSGLGAAEVAGMERWHRDIIDVMLPYEAGLPTPVEGIRYLRSRKHVEGMIATGRGVRRLQVEPAILMWAATNRSEGTIRGVLSAAVQQRLATAVGLTSWLEVLAPLKRAPLMRLTIAEISGGAQSKAEMDIRRMCRRFGLAPPQRQVKRRDANGAVRYTDCEWRLPDGRIVMLEVDGGFHMEVEHWEADLARQRALSAPHITILHCTAREARTGSEVAADLLRHGVPRAA